MPVQFFSKAERAALDAVPSIDAGDFQHFVLTVEDLQAQCLTLITNAIVCWNTVYLDAAIDHHQATGLPLSESAVRQFSPTIHEHINVYGRYDFIAPSSPPEGQLRPLQI